MFDPPVASSWLALATTAHLGFAALRNHRHAGTAPFSWLALTALVMAVLPWLFPAISGVMLGLGLQVTWFVVCERLAPPPAAPAPLQPNRQTVQSAPVEAARPALRVDRTAKPRGFVQAPVVAVLPETADIRTFRMGRPDGFEFKAGQFLAVRVKVDGQDLVRCYSLSSSPAARGYLEISVKQQGLVSRTLHATLRPGSLLSIKTPAGAFVYPANDDRPLLLLAGGIGITPLRSMLHHAVTDDPNRKVTLLYSARTEADLAFRDELMVLQRRHPQLHVVLAAGGDRTSADIYPGHIDEDLLRATTTDFSNVVAMLCGPKPMIDALRASLLSLGTPESQVRFERFEAAVAAAAAAEQAPVVELAAAGAVTGPRAAARLSAGATSCEVRCGGAAVRVRPGSTLLDAIDAGGFPIDSLCRAGVCGTCRTRVVSGDVDCASALLDESDRAAGQVLACVTAVHGDCVIEPAS